MSVRVFFRQHGFIIAAIGLALAAVAALANGVTGMQSQDIARAHTQPALCSEDILRALEAQPLGAGDDFLAIAATLATEARRQALSLELTHSLAAQLDGAAGGAPGVRAAVHDLKRDIRHLIAAAALINALAAHEAEVRMLLGLDAEPAPANRNDGCRREAS